MSQNAIIKSAQELMVQDRREGREITAASIRTQAEKVLTLFPDSASAADLDQVVEELLRRNSEWIGRALTLTERDHRPWLTGERLLGRKHWPRYREYLERALAGSVIDEIDKSTDQVLDLLEYPAREGPWDRRGLVVGDVQAGTA